MHGVVEATGGDLGEGQGFNFDVWITQNGLFGLKPLFEKHNAISPPKMTLTSPGIHSLMAELGKTQPQLIGNVLSAINNISCATVQKIVVSKEEKRVMQSISANLQCLDSEQKELLKLQEAYQSGMIQLSRSKLTQIATARSKVNVTFDEISERLQRRKQLILKNIEKIQFNVNSVDDDVGLLITSSIQDLTKSTTFLKEQQKIYEDLTSTNEDEEKREKTVIDLGEQTATAFAQSQQQLNDDMATITEDIRRNTNCVIDIELTFNDKEYEDILSGISKVLLLRNKTFRFDSDDRAYTYLSWSSQELVQWIVSLDESYSEKYTETLTKSFSEHLINGAGIDSMDREDLLFYGIIDLNDRRKIYKEMSNLIVHKQKRRRLSIDNHNNNDGNARLANTQIDDQKDSGIASCFENHVTDSTSTDTKSADSIEAAECVQPQMEDNILSLSDDEDEKEETVDTMTFLAEDQQTQMDEEGYCVLDDPMKNHEMVTAVHGFVRQHGVHHVINELIPIIVAFCSARYNEEIYVEVVCKTMDMPLECTYFLTPKRNISLCNLIKGTVEMERTSRVEITKVRPDVMRKVLRYLGHHKGNKPEEIVKPIRSVKMERIVADQWDAVFINALTKKGIFQLILAANYLDIQCLVQLGSAKIATLIKGKSPEEIKEILADTGNNKTETHSASAWVPDSHQKGCSLCNDKFTFMNRRHHCRRCGRLCCSKCSKYKLPNGEGVLQRACKTCYYAVKSSRGQK